MAQVIYARQALSDLERLMDFASSAGVPSAADTARLIAEAIGILAHHPLIGRAVEHDLRELVISRGESGYLALYSFEPTQDVVLVLAVRHQHEAGYSGD